MQSRHNAVRTLSCLALLLLLLAIAAPAQTPSGTLHGQVLDPSGAVVVQATITATGADGKTVSASTNRQGSYEIRGLAPGKYLVAATAKGFGPYEQKDVVIVAGQNQQIDIALDIAVEQQQVMVQDQASNVDVDPSNNAAAVVIKGKDLDALSDDPDELQADLEALAGPAAGPNGGQIFIDGFSNGQLPPKSAIREIRINQNPFSSEYDHLGYGRIEILTKPGMDQYHGQFMLNLNNAVFNAQNPFLHLTDPPGYNSEMYSGNFSGPLSKKASFSFNTERRNINETTVTNGVSLDSNLVQTPFSQAYTTPRVYMSLSPRVDYQVTPNNTFTARYQYNQSNTKNGGLTGMNLGTLGYDNNNTRNGLQMSDSQIINSTTVNETRFQYDRSRSEMTAQNFDPTIAVGGAFTGGGYSGGTSADHTDRFELQNMTLITHGTHLIKFGGRLRQVREVNQSTGNYSGTFTFSSLEAYQVTMYGLQQGLPMSQIRTLCMNNPSVPTQQICGGGPRQFSISTGNPVAEVTQFDAGLYAQDDWRLRPNLTLSYGLRYEMQTNISDHADVALRVAIAWGIGRGKSTPKTVLRAGWGMFYDRLGEGNVLTALRMNGVNQQQYIINAPDFYPVVPPLSTLVTGAQLSSITLIAPNFRAPYRMQAAVSVERQLGKTATLSVNYINSRALHTLAAANINAPYVGTYDPAVPTSGIRPLGTTQNVYEFVSAGMFRQNQLMTSLNIRAGAKLSLFTNYTLNFANATGNYPADPYNLLSDFGRATFDIRHRLMVMGTISLPHGLRFNPMVMATSGQPFNFTVGEDLNGDSMFNDRPAFATDLSRASVVKTRWGNFDTAPMPGQRIIPINYGTGPSMISVNMRVAKTFGFGAKKNEAAAAGQAGQAGGPRGGMGGDHGPRGGGDHGGGGFGGRGPGGMGGGAASNARYSFTVSASARNLFNRVNAAVPVGNLNSPLFGQSNALGGFGGSSNPYNRRIDLQLQFSF